MFFITDGDKTRDGDTYIISVAVQVVNVVWQSANTINLAARENMAVVGGVLYWRRDHVLDKKIARHDSRRVGGGRRCSNNCRHQTSAFGSSAGCALGWNCNFGSSRGRGRMHHGGNKTCTFYSSCTFWWARLLGFCSCNVVAEPAGIPSLADIAVLDITT